jgi:hypothetical protein
MLPWQGTDYQFFANGLGIPWGRLHFDTTVGSRAAFRANPASRERVVGHPVVAYDIFRLTLTKLRGGLNDRKKPILLRDTAYASL